MDDIFREIAMKMREAEQRGEVSIEAPLDDVERLVDAGLVSPVIKSIPSPQHGGSRTDFSSIGDRGVIWVHNLEFTEEGRIKLAELRI